MGLVSVKMFSGFPLNFQNLDESEIPNTPPYQFMHGQSPASFGLNSPMTSLLNPDPELRGMGLCTGAPPEQAHVVPQSLQCTGVRRPRAARQTGTLGPQVILEMRLYSGRPHPLGQDLPHTDGPSTGKADHVPLVKFMPHEEKLTLLPVFSG